MIAKPICQEDVKKAFNYDPETGAIERKTKRVVGRIAGKTGWMHVSGYLLVRFNGGIYQAHRLAWAFCYGEVPCELVIDHINGVRNDNRIANLRLVSHRQNMQNMGIKHTPSRLGLLKK